MEKVKDIIAITIIIGVSTLLVILFVVILIKKPVLALIFAVIFLITWSAWRVGEITARKK